MYQPPNAIQQSKQASDHEKKVWLTVPAHATPCSRPNWPRTAEAVASDSAITTILSARLLEIIGSLFVYRIALGTFSL